jgi:hypothetical protein
VKSNDGFAAFDVGLSALSIPAEDEMARHGHWRLARLGWSVDVGSMGLHGRAQLPDGRTPVVMG